MRVASIPVVLVALSLGACRPISVVLDCPPSVEIGSEFDIVVSVDKSGGETEFDVAFSWSSPNPYLAGITYVAVDDEALEEPEESGYLDLNGVNEGDVKVTAVGEPCPGDREGACWGTLNVEGTAAKKGLFGTDHESDSCVIDYTEPGGS